MLRPYCMLALLIFLRPELEPNFYMNLLTLSVVKHTFAAWIVLNRTFLLSTAQFHHSSESKNWSNNKNYFREQLQCCVKRSHNLNEVEFHLPELESTTGPISNILSADNLKADDIFVCNGRDYFAEFIVV